MSNIDAFINDPIARHALEFVEQWPWWRKILRWAEYRRAWRQFEVDMLELCDREIAEEKRREAILSGVESDSRSTT